MSVARAVDPWQTRMDRMARILPLPLLVVSSGFAVLVNGDQPHPWALGRYGVPVAALAAVLWGAVALWPRIIGSARWLPAVFAVHTALAGALVWINPAYGIFAYIGFVYAYRLGPRWRVLGFAFTALPVSASMIGGYPTHWSEQAAGFLVVTAVLMALVLNSAAITNRALEQNRERGRMIEDLAESNRRLEASMAENADLHARLVAQARESGIVEERQRLAGEIHDTLAQGLTGIIAQLQAAEQTRGRPEESARHLALARDLARNNLVDARRSVRALRPEQLEGAGLPEALADLVRTWSGRTPVAAEVEVSGDPLPIGADIEDTLFRVAQEALTNIGSHARAEKVRLTVTYLEDTVLLDVVDDGTGFDPAARSCGFGLAGMRRRLDRIGGALTVESTPGEGTSVNASVPLAATAPEPGR